MAKYYCQASGQKRGPMGTSELRQLAQRGVLRPDDPVWEENTTKKFPAKTVKGLFSPISSSPPAPIKPPPAPAKPPAPTIMPVAPPPISPPPVPELAPIAAPDAPIAAPIAAPSLRDDPGPIFKVGRRFSYKPGGAWMGGVYASPMALYLVKSGKSRNHYGGGLAGGLIAMAAAGNLDDTRTCFVAELPASVRAIADRKGKLQAKDAIILPREAISFVKVPGFNSLLTVDCGSEQFKLSTSLFKSKLRNFLTETGWKLNEPMTPTAPPIHGRGYGRTEATPPPKPMPLAKRILLIFLAIILIIGVIALRVWLG
jgi:hypothetical protein